jgi:hypothetical protein
LSIDALRSPATIRERCTNILVAIEAGRSPHWSLDAARLDAAADEVAQITRARYPSLNVPMHERAGHFEAGGVRRGAELARLLSGHDAAGRARALIDLVTVSVLLDAGAGADWRFAETASGQSFTRSEGLAVATFRAFVAGAFSSDRRDPYRADAARLRTIDAAALAAMFQVRADNPLVGLPGRAALMQRLGVALAADRARFGADGRPGALFDHLGADGMVRAEDILHALLVGLAPIWPAGNRFDGQPLGDAWRHPHAGGDGPTAGWVPFHKLTQWLTYSLAMPFAAGGVRVVELDALTALPEYRNGGLLIDAGVIVARDPALLKQRLVPGDEPVVEWRALTVALIDQLAPRVRQHLGRSAAQLPLASILEGGTWAAGRALAQRLRSGLPPLQIDSDGTVF